MRYINSMELFQVLLQNFQNWLDSVIKSGPQDETGWLTTRDMALFLVAVALAVIVSTTRFFKDRGEEERFKRRQHPEKY
jgi:hypothetical protein